MIFNLQQIYIYRPSQLMAQRNIVIYILFKNIQL